MVVHFTENRFFFLKLNLGRISSRRVAAKYLFATFTPSGINAPDLMDRSPHIPSPSCPPE